MAFHQQHWLLTHIVVSFYLLTVVNRIKLVRLIYWFVHLVFFSIPRASCTQRNVSLKLQCEARKAEKNASILAVFMAVPSQFTSSLALDAIWDSHIQENLPCDFSSGCLSCAIRNHVWRDNGTTSLWNQVGWQWQDQSHHNFHGGLWISEQLRISFISTRWKT